MEIRSLLRKRKHQQPCEEKIGWDYCISICIRADVNICCLWQPCLFVIFSVKEVFDMLNENIKIGRKSKGLSQDELAIKLNVVRQTVSKWERGLSVPDSEMLISLSEILEIPVSKLLDENIELSKADELEAISQKLEVINLQLAQKKETTRNFFHVLMIVLCVGLILIFAALMMINGSYLNWDYKNPELAAAGVLIHGFEWLFIRLFPIALIGLIVGIVITRKSMISDKLEC